MFAYIKPPAQTSVAHHFQKSLSFFRKRRVFSSCETLSPFHWGQAKASRPDHFYMHKHFQHYVYGLCLCLRGAKSLSESMCLYGSQYLTKMRSLMTWHSSCAPNITVYFVEWRYGGYLSSIVKYLCDGWRWLWDGRPESTVVCLGAQFVDMFAMATGQHFMEKKQATNDRQEQKRLVI